VDVSDPRPIFPGATYLVTRRCTQRQFLLKPSPLTNQIFLYCLGFAAQQTRVQIHAVVTMSNHYHCVVTDPEGLLPRFTELLHKYTAKCLNASYGRWENLWATEASSYVRLVGAEDVLAKIVYTLTNPVAAALVERARYWEGVHLWKPGARWIRRPEVLFREHGPMPEKIRLEIAPPPLGEPGSHAVRRIAEAVRTREDELRRAIKAAARTFLGAKAVRSQRITDSPGTREPRRGLSPRIAARSKWLRIESLQRLKSFVTQYRAALGKWRLCIRDVIFPEGTYAMRRFHSVPCLGAAGP
jgi:REP element-mobilizing transposase RayT